MTVTQVTLIEVNNEKTAYELRLLDADSSDQYQMPLFKLTGKECDAGGDFEQIKYLGLRYGSCAPTVDESADKDASCPTAPAGFQTPQVGDENADCTKFRCELPCNADENCAGGSVCIAKSSPNSKFDGVCLFLDQESHHSFDSPYGVDKDHKQCLETSAGDGVDVVEFETTTIKAGICAPRAREGKCPASDYPEDSAVIPLAVKDMDGQKTHCMLECKAPSNICPGTSKCLVVEIATVDISYCLYDPSVPIPPTQLLSASNSNHKFETPYNKKCRAPKCTESDAEFVEFDTSDSKKAGICAPKPQDGKCSADDHPEGSTALPKSIKDANGSHCELDCSADQTCPGDSKCTSVKTVKSQLFAMRLEDGGDCKICLYSREVKKSFLMY